VVTWIAAGGTQSETRKLATILVADVVGYSRLAGADEDRALARLRGLRSDLIDPAIAAKCQLDRFRIEAEKAVALNPCDADNLGNLGIYLAFSGFWDEGTALAKKPSS
jgi:hypothetical protein